jgi:hypothetical protein
MKISLAGTIALIALVVPSTAGAESWQSVGPPGGTATAIAPATGSTTVYLSTIGGSIWAQDGPGGRWSLRGQTWGNAPSLWVDPRNPRHLFTASDMGLTESSDGAVTWFRPVGTNYGHIAWGAGEIYSYGWEGLLTSADGGATFTVRNADHAFLGLAAGRHRGWLFATAADGFWTSRDDGAQWKHQKGFPTPVDGVSGGAGSVAIEPGSDDRTIYVSMAGALVKSTNEGETWTTTGYSDPSGASAPITIDPAHPQTLLLSTQSGILRSTNGARSFKTLPAPTDAAGTSSQANLAFDADKGGLLYAAGTFNTAFSANDATTWTFSSAGLADAACTTLTADPVVAGTLWCPLQGPGIIARTRNGGATWDSIRPSSDPSFNPSNVTITTGPAPAVLVNDYATILRSTDRGVTWTPVDLGGAGYINTVRAGAGGTVWVTGADANWVSTVYLSSDDGATFVALDQTATANATDITPDPFDPNRAYAPAFLGVWITADGGATWTYADQGLDSIQMGYTGTSITTDPTTPGRLILRGDSPNDNFDPFGHWFESLDHGSTWTEMTSLAGLLHGDVMPVGRDGTLWQTVPTGVASSASGALWTQHLGLPGSQFPRVAVDAANTVWVNAGGYGVYRLNP